MKRDAKRYTRSWSVEVDQRDEDSFHGTHSFLASTLALALAQAVQYAEAGAYPDTVKIVITAMRERVN